MTDRALPAWVVKRVENATNAAAPDFEMFAGECMIEAGLAEFLAILEERARPGWQIHFMRDGRSDYVPLAELLEDREHE